MRSRLVTHRFPINGVVFSGYRSSSAVGREWGGWGGGSFSRPKCYFEYSSTAITHVESRKWHTRPSLKTSQLFLISQYAQPRHYQSLIVAANERAPSPAWLPAKATISFFFFGFYFHFGRFEKCTKDGAVCLMRRKDGG